MNQIKETVDRQRNFFNSNATKSLDFRKKQLTALKDAVNQYENELLEALNKDLNKTVYEGYMSELGLVKTEIDYMLRKMRSLARPKLRMISMAQFPARASVRPEPYGVVLIMSPWNYPLLLTLSPLAGAIAAGNCVVVKPSNYSPNTSAVMAKLLSDIFPPEYVSTLEGGREVNSSLLEEHFDYIFFTGGSAVGKVVMAAAARHLTPLTLELGGKSPCIVDETADIDLAAKRIVWGKFLNAGQTCVAPDYILVHESVKDTFIDHMTRYIRHFYGDEVYRNHTFPKIVSQKHFDRLLGLLENQTIISGGSSNRATLQIEPTLLDNPAWDSPVMLEEIFGPILPVIDFDNLTEVIDRIRERPKPLALYFFSSHKISKHRILNDLSFGGGCINDTILHMATSHMPFGGVGDSGMGSYHGKDSFRTFSHYKSVLHKSRFPDPPVRYPAATRNIKILKKLL